MTTTEEPITIVQGRNYKVIATSFFWKVGELVHILSYGNTPGRLPEAKLLRHADGSLPAMGLEHAIGTKQLGPVLDGYRAKEAAKAKRAYEGFVKEAKGQQARLEANLLKLVRQPKLSADDRVNITITSQCISDQHLKENIYQKKVDRYTAMPLLIYYPCDTYTTHTLQRIRPAIYAGKVPKPVEPFVYSELRCR